MKILGIDPGSWHTGVGVIESEGNRYRLVYSEVIHMHRTHSLPKRLHQIYHSLREIVLIYKPDVMALENVFYGRDVKAMVKIGEARACAMLAASGSDIDVVEYPPARIKQAVSGSGRATKEQVRNMIKRLLNMKTLPPSDGADALAAAICHLHSSPQRKNNLLDPVKPVRRLRTKDLLERAGKKQGT